MAGGAECYCRVLEQVFLGSGMSPGHWGCVEHQHPVLLTAALPEVQATGQCVRLTVGSCGSHFVFSSQQQ